MKCPRWSTCNTMAGITRSFPVRQYDGKRSNIRRQARCESRNYTDCGLVGVQQLSVPPSSSDSRLNTSRPCAKGSRCMFLKRICHFKCPPHMQHQMRPVSKTTTLGQSRSVAFLVPANEQRAAPKSLREPNGEGKSKHATSPLLCDRTQRRFSFEMSRL